MNEGRIVRSGVDKHARARSRKFLEYGKDGVCLPSWNFCSFPTARLSRLPPSAISQHLYPVVPGIKLVTIAHDNNSALRTLCLQPHPVSLVRSLCHACSGLTHFQLNSGADSVAQSCLCTSLFSDFQISPDQNHQLRGEGMPKEDLLLTFT